jgi:hypothetical protein
MKTHKHNVYRTRFFGLAHGRQFCRCGAHREYKNIPISRTEYETYLYDTFSVFGTSFYRQEYGKWHGGKPTK